jgi:hypothetical protein
LIQEYRNTPLAITQNFVTSTSNWIAQRFKPILHPEATAWSVSRVSFYIKRNNSGSAGQFRIKIHEIDPLSGKPMSNEVTSIIVDTPSLPADFEWAEFQFPSPVDLKPCTSYALVIAPFGAPGNRPQIQFEQGLSQLLANAFRMTSSNAGSSWTSPDGLSCVRFQISGTMKTQTWK